MIKKVDTATVSQHLQAFESEKREREQQLEKEETDRLNQEALQDYERLDQEDKNYVDELNLKFKEWELHGIMAAFKDLGGQAGKPGLTYS